MKTAARRRMLWKWLHMANDARHRAARVNPGFRWW
jgi:hypothetical protein